MRRTVPEERCKSASGNPLGGIIGIVQLSLGGIAIAYILVATVVYDAATLIFASTGPLNDAFKFGDGFVLARRTVGDLVIAFVVTAMGGTVLVLASLITCGLASPSCRPGSTS